MSYGTARGRGGAADGVRRAMRHGPPATRMAANLRTVFRTGYECRLADPVRSPGRFARSARKPLRVAGGVAAFVSVACGFVAYRAATAADPLPSATRPAETRPATQPAAAAGWKSLFDGKTLSGWKSSEYG